MEHIYVIKTDRGFIEYTEFYHDIDELQYGVTLDIDYAKRYMPNTANRILRRLKSQNQSVVKIPINNIGGNLWINFY